MVSSLVQLHQTDLLVKNNAYDYQKKAFSISLSFV